MEARCAGQKVAGVEPNVLVRRWQIWQIFRWFWGVGSLASEIDGGRNSGEAGHGVVRAATCREDWEAGVSCRLGSSLKKLAPKGRRADWRWCQTQPLK